jgi:cephalosporin-C deacetylase-like acetyl esterase
VEHIITLYRKNVEFLNIKHGGTELQRVKKKYDIPREQSERRPGFVNLTDCSRHPTYLNICNT